MKRVIVDVTDEQVILINVTNKRIVELQETLNTMKKQRESDSATSIGRPSDFTERIEHYNLGIKYYEFELEVLKNFKQKLVSAIND